MRKIIVLSFITIDGVMQAPGGPNEDTSGGFEYGGWTVPFFDDFLGKVMDEQMKKPFDLLLGRKTFDIFESYWPKQSDEFASGINEATKYVVSTTREKSNWEKTQFINTDVVNEIKALKATEGADLQVHGSGNLIQTLMENGLVDEFLLKIFPIMLGTGKKLFARGVVPATYTLIDSKTSPLGVIIASYSKKGEIKTGSFE